MPTIASLVEAPLRSLPEALAGLDHPQLSPCALVELDENDRPRLLGGGVLANTYRFQYAPESVSLTKAVNYQQKEIPSGSLPLYQWIASGEHLVSFSATFSSDVDLVALQAQTGTNMVTKMGASGLGDRNVDPRAAVVWLRQYVFPLYARNGQERASLLTAPPSKLMLWMPNSGLGLYGGTFAGSAYPADAMIVVMTQCDITLEAFFPSGMPRLVTAQLSFAQVPQFGGQITFPQAGPAMAALASGSDPRTQGYALRPRPGIRWR